MYWLSLFSIIALGITTNGAPYQIKLLNLLNDGGVRSLFEVDSMIEVPEFEITSPAQVSSNRATRSLPLHRYQRRFTRSPELRDIDPYPQTTELTFNAFGINFHLNLTKSSFIAPDMVLQRGPGGRVINPVDSCYYQGNIIGYEKQNIVTVSTCNAEVTTSLSRHKRGIRNLDAITTQTIELVVMVDSTVYEYFDSSDTLVQDFVLSFVNALDLLLRNPGLGAYDLNLKLLGIHFFHDSGELEDPEEVTSQTNQCDSGEGCIGELSLMKDLWERVNEGYQADHGIYLTKRKLCFADMTGCQQSGYAPLGGMCGGRSSLSVARADGLQATSEEAHELGHNLGIVHDGEASGGCYDSMHNKRVLNKKRYI
ncbi:A disintegrin and metalloproteinase with thrombospondin motifs 2-like [Anneissia japonica]|uniref:A disintegrin and metalloproteinase with thrombospondin motifs 2-like n=1 Tax=Anneissia japonica TaxID=1529436 RepID=UPI0014257BEF|nr:A disintegrin and metalloproteinase with thrombospondin motifs 2-like [Anneissia japonica]